MPCIGANGERCASRLENLQLLCPDCHSQTDNYAGRNRPRNQSQTELVSGRVRVLGLPIETPYAVLGRAASDLGAVARMARAAPVQLERLLQLGEEIASTGHRVLAIAERLDQRAEAILAMGERIEARADGILTIGEVLDARADSIVELGERLDQRAGALIELGERMGTVGDRVDTHGAAIVDSANRVADTGNELIGVLPALERAVAMATPLEGAIDRFGRLVDRLPGGAPRRRPEALSTAPDRSAIEANVVAEPRTAARGPTRNPAPRQSVPPARPPRRTDG